MEFAVRRLRRDDCTLVGWLEQLARSAAAEIRGGPALLAETPLVGDWGDHVDDDRRPTWVSTLDGDAVGFLEAKVDGVTLSVRQVFVHPDAREHGLGDELLAAAVEHARRSGCVRVEGTALPGDRDTKNLYERAGITARKITVSRTLD
ncbi:MAG: N-acetyltransferase family protein [Ilumatobacteraceae bacterium]